jgi:peptidoglycan hydrolase-like protein with peptidoglycan-binding domain
MLRHYHVLAARSLLILALSLALLPSLCAAQATFERPLTIGSRGADVSALQQYLKEQGYFSYPQITGYFGPYTWKAVAAFSVEERT